MGIKQGTIWLRTPRDEKFNKEFDEKTSHEKLEFDRLKEQIKESEKGKYSKNDNR